MRFVDVSKPEWLEYVQKTNFTNYVKGPMMHSVLHEVLGDGIFATDDEEWKRARQAISKIFNVNSFKRIVVPSVNKSMRDATRMLKSAADQGRSLDFCDFFYRFTLDSFVHMALVHFLNPAG